MPEGAELRAVISERGTDCLGLCAPRASESWVTGEGQEEGVGWTDSMSAIMVQLAARASRPFRLCLRIGPSPLASALAKQGYPDIRASWPPVVVRHRVGACASSRDPRSRVEGGPRDKERSKDKEEWIQDRARVPDRGIAARAFLQTAIRGEPRAYWPDAGIGGRAVLVWVVDQL